MTWAVRQTSCISLTALSLVSSPLTQLCPQFYRSNVVPIAALFAAVLWCAARRFLVLADSLPACRSPYTVLC